jgi:ribulose-phosphate 3-epimerase
VFTFTTFAPVLHLDIMDGALAPHASWPYTEDGIPSILLPSAKLYSHIAVHLMVQSPWEIGMAFARAGVPSITVQFEGCASADEAKEVLASWRAAGVSQLGIAVLLDTPFSSFAPVVDQCDFLQVMSIGRIGFQGEPFDIRAIQNLKELHAAYPHMPLIVDGGITKDNIGYLVAAGASRFAVGSAIVKASDPLSAYRELVAAVGRVQ